MSRSGVARYTMMHPFCNVNVLAYHVAPQLSHSVVRLVAPVVESLHRVTGKKHLASRSAEYVPQAV